ncbi:MAG TPA: lytic transglycosylase domain-containing protein [Caulobacteraceae bacterium]|jgi:soluble lytic murein transglycosylase-like protein|nr:lytic transglycosylase domain-containing protein [Caulobacteraceae bacterium]
MRAELAAAMLLLGFCAGAAEAQAPPSTNDAIGAALAEAGRRFCLPESWIRAVIRAESAGEPGARSAKGAMGLMQLMPNTWAALRAELGLGADPYDVHDNVVAGAAYLRQLYDQFGPAGFLAAYDAGPGRYLDFISHRRPLPGETRAYLAAVAPLLGARAVTGSPSVSRREPPSVFATLDAFDQRPIASARLFAIAAGK